MNRTSRIMILITTLAGSIAILFASLWVQSSNTLLDELKSQAEQGLWPIANIVQKAYSVETGWPTNVCVTNASVSSVFNIKTGGPYCPQKFDSLLLDPWKNPYHMTLKVYQQQYTQLSVWSFGGNQKNNQGAKDDIALQITIPITQQSPPSDVLKASPEE